MPETVVINGLPSGLVLTIDIYPLGSDSADATGVALTELTNSKTTYTASVSNLSGRKNILIKYGADVIATGMLNIAPNGGGTFVVDDAGAELFVRTGSELASVPGAAPAFYDMLWFLYAALRNLSIEAGTSMKVTNDAGTVIGTATLADNGTTLRKSKYQ